jgi:hypothetical protein
MDAATRSTAPTGNVSGASLDDVSAPPREIHAASPNVAAKIAASTAMPPRTGTTARPSADLTLTTGPDASDRSASGGSGHKLRRQYAVWPGNAETALG